MSPDERRAIQSIERRVALENELERRKTEHEIDRLNEQINPSPRVQMRKMVEEIKDLRVKLPKIVVK